MKETALPTGAGQRRTNRVVIIGAGLIGASIGCALSRPATQSIYVTTRSATPESQLAWVPAQIDPPVSADVALVVIAVPPGAIPDLVVHSLQVYPNATITDVGSVKAGCSTPCGSEISISVAMSARTRWLAHITPGR